MKPVSMLVLLCLLICGDCSEQTAFLCPSALAQATAAEALSPLLKLYVAITDKEGEAVTTIPPDQLEVIVKDSPQPIVSARLEHEPASIGILLDVSTSERKHFSAMLDAVRSFLEHSSAGSEFFLLTFGQELKLVSEFADQKTTIAHLPALTPEKKSRVYDGLKLGLEKIQSGKYEKRALILVTDGQEDGSQISYRKLLKIVKKDSPQIYSLGVGNTESGGFDVPGDYWRGHLFLEELADITGGDAFDKDKPDQLIREAKLIADRLKQEYRLDFRPAKGTGEKAWNKLKVRDHSQLPSLRFHTRKEYYY